MAAVASYPTSYINRNYRNYRIKVNGLAPSGKKLNLLVDMLLQYKTTDRFLLSSLCEVILRSHPEVSFSWIPFLSMLCVFCADQPTAVSVVDAVRADLGVEPLTLPAV